MTKVDLRSVAKLLGVLVLAWSPFAAGSVGVDFLSNHGALSPKWWQVPCLLFALVSAPLVFSAVSSRAATGATRLLSAFGRLVVINLVVAFAMSAILGAIVWLLTGDGALAESEIVAYLAITALCLVGLALMVFAEHRRQSQLPR